MEKNTYIRLSHGKTKRYPHKWRETHTTNTFPRKNTDTKSYSRKRPFTHIYTHRNAFLLKISEYNEKNPVICV